MKGSDRQGEDASAWQGNPLGSGEQVGEVDIGREADSEVDQGFTHARTPRAVVPCANRFPSILGSDTRGRGLPVDALLLISRLEGVFY